MDIDVIKSTVTGTLLHDLLRYAIGAGGVYVVVNVALAGVLARRQIRPDRPGWRQMRREILTSLRTVLVFALHGIAIGLGARAGWLPVYGSVAEYGWPWFWVSIVLVIVLQDAWFYWTHWLMHRPRFYRFFHRTHHRSHNPTPFTSYAFDTGEAAVHAVFLLLFVAVVPMHPTAILVFAVHMMARNVVGHCGYELFPARRDGRPLFGWMTTVTHHDQHHANARYNLGLYFTWWDRWMGTEHPDYTAAFRSVVRGTGTRVPKARPHRGVLPILVAGLILFAPSVSRAGVAELEGLYAAPGLSMVVRFEPCPGPDGTVCGRLVWAWEPDDMQHVRPGDLLLSGLRAGPDGWAGGRLVHPESGRVFRGSVRISENGFLALRGCAGPICTGQTWRPLDTVRNALARLK